MDVSILAIVASIIIALTGIIPGTLALIKQGKIDDKKSQIESDRLEFEMSNAANAALSAVITPMKEELLRCQTRIGELEQALIAKTNQIGDLMQQGIDKDLKISLLNGNILLMQIRLDAFTERENNSAAKTAEGLKRTDDVAQSLSLREKDILVALEEKERIRTLTLKENQDLMAHSINSDYGVNEEISGG